LRPRLPTIRATAARLRASNPFAGAVVSNITPRIADQLRLPSSLRGVMVTEVPASRSQAAMDFGPVT
jgi:hypothetical protein